MRPSPDLKAAVSIQMKARVRALAQQQFISEAIWLRRVVAAALRAATPEDPATSDEDLALPPRSAPNASRSGKVSRQLCTSIRLRPEDWRSLQARARARSMPSGTYVSVLVRAHLHRLTPLPANELVALKRSVAELGAIRRNLQRLARPANSADQVTGLAREDLWALLEVCQALRAHVKDLIKTNLTSWEVGDGA